PTKKRGRTTDEERIADAVRLGHGVVPPLRGGTAPSPQRKQPSESGGCLGTSTRAGSPGHMVREASGNIEVDGPGRMGPVWWEEDGLAELHEVAAEGEGRTDEYFPVAAAGGPAAGLKEAATACPAPLVRWPGRASR